jgi:MoaA/NifB/PqqE/SkfB family radical SAM enzyme
MIFAVTAKCPLQCEHCFEWNNLDSTEPLMLEELKQILGSFQQRGVLQVQLSGGEPLCRFDDTIELLKNAQPGTDFWLLTSGFGLTFEKAITLKKVGLTGVNISLDHWQKDAHNAFRKNDLAFQWTHAAATHCRNADLALAFSLCATKEFVSHENLEKYLALTTELGAGFVQILEPRKAGHFSGQDVELQVEHMQMLENFYINTNDNAVKRHAPIITYPGYHQRRLGCFGAGNRYLYVDAVGDLHACPFCQRKVGNVLRDSIEKSIIKMREIGCHKYDMVLEN